MLWSQVTSHTPTSWKRCRSESLSTWWSWLEKTCGRPSSSRLPITTRKNVAASSCRCRASDAIVTVHIGRFTGVSLNIKHILIYWLSSSALKFRISFIPSYILVITGRHMVYRSGNVLGAFLFLSSFVVVNATRWHNGVSRSAWQCMRRRWTRDVMRVCPVRWAASYL